MGLFMGFGGVGLQGAAYVKVRPRLETERLAMVITHSTKSILERIGFFATRFVECNFLRNYEILPKKSRVGHADHLPFNSVR